MIIDLQLICDVWTATRSIDETAHVAGVKPRTVWLVIRRFNAVNVQTEP